MFQVGTRVLRYSSSGTVVLEGAQDANRSAQCVRETIWSGLVCTGVHAGAGLLQRGTVMLDGGVRTNH